ncbi:MAG: hypothetical protein GYA24_23505 [Candidatus Lokiarchaeota archaeon]|nr:hypothetical protein [Candidatus Lokiarchaeota archaeon]
MSREDGIKIQGIAPKDWDARKPKAQQARHARYEFIDQFRGLCVLFLTFAWVTIQLGWYKLVPAILTHGFIFYSDQPVTTWNWLQMGNNEYTWIDLGSSLFVLLVGVSTPISFRSRMAKSGKAYAIGRLFLRYGIFVLVQYFLDSFMGFPPNYRGLLLGHKEFMTRLGIGSVAAGAAVLLVKRPDRRFLIVIGLLAVHAILYLMPGLEVFRDSTMFKEPIAWMGNGHFFDYYMIPFEAISFSALAIAGTCFWDWLNEGGNVALAIKRRIMPVAVYSWVACFVALWFIPLSHWDLTVSQDLLALGMGFFMLVLFLAAEQFFKYKVPYLTALGRNALILYIIGFLGEWIYMDSGVFAYVIPETAWLGLVLCAGLVVPVTALGWILDKHKIYWRF